MLRMSVKDEEYLMIGENVKIVFLGSSGNQTKIMIDAPREINIARSRAIEKRQNSQRQNSQGQNSQGQNS